LDILKGNITKPLGCSKEGNYNELPPCKTGLEWYETISLAGWFATSPDRVI